MHLLIECNNKHNVDVQNERKKWGMFKPMREKVTGRRRGFQYEEIHNWY